MTGVRVLPLTQPPDLLALHAGQPQRYPALLESTAGPAIRSGAEGRYDLLFIHDGQYLALSNDGRLQATGFTPAGGDFLDNLDRWYAQAGAPMVDALPFQGGWFLFLAYELAGLIEPVLALPPAPPELPVALALRCPAAIVHDRIGGRSLLIAEAGQEALLAQVRADIRALPFAVPAREAVTADIGEEAPERFVGAVERIREYIRAGDVFQVNLSRRWDVMLKQDISAAALYRRLRHTNPAPFSGLLQWQGTALLSSSPERLVCSRAGRIETRPIAGTHPRLENAVADHEQAAALLRHPKERAEHVMLLDLERNDLGRVCEPGSVSVSEFMTLETYAHVHHIVSNVQGRLRRGTGPGGVIRAVFPGGTITGAPKVRCMQIIAELEGEGRGAYTGSMGYLDRSGDMDLNILIRSLVLRQRRAVFRTGAGIVADSDPLRELEETRAKARGLLRLFETGS
jgi:anthranilate synthase component I